MEEKNPFEMLQKAEHNFNIEFNKLMEDWFKYYDYVKPFTDQIPQYKEIADSINAKMIALPIARMTMNLANVTMVKTVSDSIKMNLPPLKIECPDCKKVIWDISDIKGFIDPEGKLYGKN